MDNDYTEYSDEFIALMSGPPILPNFLSFEILPQKRKDRKDQCGYSTSRFNVPPPSDFLCILCQSVAKKPVECKKCGKLYCGSCANMLKKIDESNGSRVFSCSICGSSQEPKQPSMVLTRMIGELRMKCTNYDLGCLNFVAIEEIGRHELVCPFREVPCENHRSCKKVGLIKDFIESESTHRSIYSHISPRGHGRCKSFTCSEKCRKVISFEKLVNEKQHHKTLIEYYNVLLKKDKKTE